MATNHFLNSFLAWICFRLFGGGALSLRLPNLLALLILILAVYRLTKKLTQTSAKLILVSGLLLSFNWLSFFNMCRGYGISMSFAALAFSYTLDFIENKRFIHVLKAYILLDLAICASLPLILAVTIATILICLFQVCKQLFLKVGNIVILVLHMAFILFWIKYLFYLQHLNGLYSGPGGHSYWKVTFVTLINAIVGKQNLLINLAVVGIYIIVMIVGVCFLFRHKRQSQSPQVTIILFLVALINLLVMGIYVLKKIYGVNYPEDRTALVFYLLLIITAGFSIDKLKPAVSRPIATIVLIVFASHYAISLNFQRHPLKMYSVIPQRYYDRLLEEQKRNPVRITVQGNDFFEPIYAYMNYRHNGALNYLDYRDSMLMDDDYFIAVKRARKYYTPYYKEIDSNKDNDFVLLKRKQPLERVLVFNGTKKDTKMDTNSEYFNFLTLNDTVFSKPNPLMAEINFKVISGDMPTFFWLVIAIDSAEGKKAYYERIPLNRIKPNWLGTEKAEDLIIETAILPKKIHRLVCYLWNVEHQKVDIEVNSVKLFQIEGPGACVKAPSIEIIPPR